MRTLFWIYLLLSVGLIANAIAGGGSASHEHAGAWIAALGALVLAQPWIFLVGSFFPNAELTALPIGLSLFINLVILGAIAFRKRDPRDRSSK